MRDSKGNIGLPNLPVSAAQKRAVEIVIEKLKEQGHKVVDFNISQEENDEMLMIYLSNANFSITHNIKTVYDGYEYVDPYYLSLIYITKIPDFVKRFIVFILRLLGLNRLAIRVRAMKNMTPERIDRTFFRKFDF